MAFQPLHLNLSAVLVLVCASTLTARQEAAQPIPRFESDVLPIFEQGCLACHGEKLQQNGLDLRTRESVLRGGESGPAVQPGSATESLLYAKVADGSMPLGSEKLKAEDIEAIRRWIDSGALKQGEDVETAVKSAPAAPVSYRDVTMSILHVRCVVCHGRRKQEADLDVRTRASLLRGGKSGPAIIPGNPDESLLIQRIAKGDMPPSALQRPYAVRPVTSDELETLRRWIAEGAAEGSEEVLQVDGELDPLVSEEDRQYWSFRPPQRPPVPRVRGKDLVRTPVDAFLLAKLEAEGLSFSPEADHLVLLRRAYMDLIGLPPEPEEVEAYRRDESPDAYERLIDRLLASPHYGERWARYWLDAAGYADSEGSNNSDAVRSNAYRYRDYIIRSLNSDKAYDRFLMEQIAGDEMFDYKAAGELKPDELEKLVATGFLRTASDGTYDITENFIPARMDVVANQVNIFSSTVMGLTMACARCHSHKYDPIPQRDYYRFNAIFQTAYDPYDWLLPNKQLEDIRYGVVLPERYLSHAPEAERREVEAHNAPIQEEVKRLEGSLEEKARPYREELLEERLGKLPEGVRTDVRQALKTPAEDRSPVQKYLVEKFAGALEIKKGELEERFEDYKEEVAKIGKAIAEAKKGLKREPRIRALFDLGEVPTPSYLLRRGDYQNPGGRVEPGVPSVLRAGLKPYQVLEPGWTTETTGRRLALARWLVQPHHPLTSRVMVNRVWQHHFGRGLVETPGNFGLTGAKPTHPELLDWLATEFVRKGWSLKRLHKLIMTSTVYRQESWDEASKEEKDPGNQLLSRFPLRRLDADAIRDIILKVAGRLDRTQYGPAVELEVRGDGEVIEKCGDRGCRRSIYILQRRSAPVTILQAFDAPQLTPNCLQRPESTVSIQALQLWNSEMARENARHFAGRVMDAVGEKEVAKQVERIYLSALSRPPTHQERAEAVEEITGLTGKWGDHFDEKVPAGPTAARARWEALATFCHAMLNSAEFIYVD